MTAPVGKSNRSGATPTTLVELAVDLDGLSDDVGIGGEAALPEPVADHDDPLSFRVGCLDEPAFRWRDLEQPEEVC